MAASQALFGRSDLEDVDERTLAAAVDEVPSVRVFAEADGLPAVADLMAMIKIVPSKSAARRAIAEGGAYLNNRRVTSEDAAPGPADLLHDRYLILRVGKRTVGAVEVVSK
jgi:tyrosyl-tRNA synthetase